MGKVGKRGGRANEYLNMHGYQYVFLCVCWEIFIGCEEEPLKDIICGVDVTNGVILWENLEGQCHHGYMSLTLLRKEGQIRVSWVRKCWGASGMSFVNDGNSQRSPTV